MNLRQLRYVVATADHGTMTAAAQALYVAQPALSRAVRELERELGVELFARSGRGVVVTDMGEEVVRYARIALDAVDAIEGVPAARADRRGGELRIALTPSLEPELTGGLLPGFARDRPAVRVRVIRCEMREAVPALLRSGRADLAVTDLPVPGDLVAHPLEQRELVLISPPRLRLRDPLTSGELTGLRLILPARGGGLRTEVDSMLARLGVRPVPAIESDDRAAWLEHVRSGTGSLLSYRDQLDDTEGVVVRSFAPPITRLVGLVHAHRRLPPAAGEFLAFAKEHRPAGALQRGEGRQRGVTPWRNGGPQRNGGSQLNSGRPRDTGPQRAVGPQRNRALRRDGR